MVVTKRLTVKFNEALQQREGEQQKNTFFPKPSFPTLLGWMKTDRRIEDPEFRELWRESFPRVEPPCKGNLWLIFRWDESTFRSLKTFPLLPQVVQVNEYLNKRARDEKRWRFVRKIMLKRFITTHNHDHFISIKF